MMKFGTALAVILMSGLMAATPGLAQDELANDEESLNILMEEGETVYTNNCAACHGADGEGGGGPALADSNFVAGRSAVIYQILFGAMDHGMPAFGPILDDREVAAVSTYIRNTWENDDGIVLPRSVELRRAAGEDEAAAE